jgi:hypothetical protein
MNKFMNQADQYALAFFIHLCMMQRKLALRGLNPTQVIEFTPLDEYELYNSSDAEETSREIEEEWHTDDDVRIRGNLVYTMPEVSAESRRKEHRRNGRMNCFAER